MERRVVNALYGPIFAYLMGGLLLILGSWFKFQIVTSFLFLIISGFLMYHLLRYCQIERKISLFIGLVYMDSFPVDTWVNEQTFSGIGAALMPLVILEGIKLARSYRIKIIPLALLITLLAQIHIMSTVIAILALLPFSVMSFYRCTIKRHWLKEAVITVFITLGLTGNIWGSLLDAFSSNHIIPPFPETDMSNPNYAIMWNNGNLSLLSNIYIVIGIITIAMIFTYHIHLANLQKLIIFICILFLWLSSAYFPWLIFSRHFVFIQQTIQFPKRFISIFVILLLVIFGKEINSIVNQFNHDHSIIPLIIAILLVVLSGNAVSQENHTIITHTNDWQSKQISITNNSYHPKMNLNRLRNAYLSTDLSKGIRYFIKSTPDYVPTDYAVNANNFKKLDPYDRLTKDIQRIQLKGYLTKKHHLWYGIVPIKNRLNFHKIIRGNQLLIRWHQPQSRNHKPVTLPVVKYGHTQVKLDHKIIIPKINRTGAIYFKSSSGNHQITLQYHASNWWKLSMCIMVIS